MIKPSIRLQDLRRRIYVKAKADKAWRFWGLYVHVCKMETLEEAYRMAKRNKGGPGIDGVTFEAIEARGVEAFLEDIREQLVTGTYWPTRNRRKEIPKADGKVRVLGIPILRSYCTSYNGLSSSAWAGWASQPTQYITNRLFRRAVWTVSSLWLTQFGDGFWRQFDPPRAQGSFLNAI